MRGIEASLLIAFVALSFAPSAAAQRIEQPEDSTAAMQQSIAPLPMTRTGQTAASIAGRIGQRQTRDSTIAGIEPLARIDSRIQNRVESRIRTRIDRYYDPQANAVSPFVVAGERVKQAGRSTRR
ncbi:hypothetical protein [Sphingomonas melonis]|uniref:hypothetical protein n=1 Tax=Sphingomonas melonis TaxID=152682 RepID=UPI0012E98F27|nr:hypothetical protein [Sphingomonas melonis]